MKQVTSIDQQVDMPFGENQHDVQLSSISSLFPPSQSKQESYKTISVKNIDDEEKQTENIIQNKSSHFEGVMDRKHEKPRDESGEECVEECYGTINIQQNENVQHLMNKDIELTDDETESNEQENT